MRESCNDLDLSQGGASFPGAFVAGGVAWQMSIHAQREPGAHPECGIPACGFVRALQYRHVIPGIEAAAARFDEADPMPGGGEHCMAGPDAS
ncbi:MAG: hypothetical protein IT479_13585 [Xanthomonadales bacterium]|nr:hypothetical protein [Xanthomonadales bacterium]MCC6594290.1 hypothetical protein [Xanthomonadales bacterium]